MLINQSLLFIYSQYVIADGNNFYVAVSNMQYSQATGSANSNQMVRNDEADRQHKKRSIILSDKSKDNVVPVRVMKPYVGVKRHNSTHN